MRNFPLVLMALIVVFLGGWLFGAEFPPPHVRDINVTAAAWLVVVLIAVALAAAGSSGRGYR